MEEKQKLRFKEDGVDKMEIKRFKLVYTIKRDEFYRIKNLNAFDSRVAYNKIRINLFLKCKNKVEYLSNKNILSKWWGGYYQLKDLVNDYSYLDIDIEFYECWKDSLVRGLARGTMNQMRKDGII